MRKREKICLHCGVVFERKRQVTALCPSCRTIRRREQDAENKRRRREEREEILERISDTLATLTADHVSWAREKVDDYLSEPAAHARGPAMPAGSKSAAGPNEGSSTYFGDLRDELDMLSSAAEHYSWWSDNPPEDVFFGLGEIEDVQGYFASFAHERESTGCGDVKGSQAGYQRHVRAGESACDECLEAQAAYYRAFRAKRISA